MANLNLPKFSGLDTLHTPSGIKDEKQAILVNFDLTEQGYIRKRPGATRFPLVDDVESLMILGRFKTVSYDQILVYNGTDDDLMQMGVGGGTLVDISTSANSGMSHAAQYGDIMYLCNFQASPQTWDGTTLSDMVGKVVGSQNLFHKDREWIINSIAGASWDIVRFSEIAGSGGTNFDAANHPAANNITVGRGDGQHCTKLIQFNDNLYIFKSQSTWALFTDTNTPADWTLRQIEPSIGCTSKDAAVVHENLLYFASLQGIYRTDGTTFEELSAPIRDFWIERGLPSILWELIFYEALVIVGDKLFCFVRDENGTTPQEKNRCFVYNIKTKGWAEYQWALDGNSVPRTPIVLQDQSPVGMYFSARASTTGTSRGYLYEWGDNNVFVDTSDVARGYESKFRTKNFDFGEPGTDKRMLNATLDYWHAGDDATWTWYYEDGTSSIDYLIDSSQVLVSVSGIPPEDYSRSLMPLRPAGWFRSIMGEFSDNSGTVDCIIYALTFNTTERKIAGRSINQEP